MKTFIALLRGINVGGNNKLPMKDLRATLSNLGFENVKTYIQSGNVVFQTDSGDAEALADQISKAIQDDFGFAPNVMITSAEQLQLAIEQNPFKKRVDDHKTMHFYFLGAEPGDEALDQAKALSTETEQCALIGKVFYLYAPDGVARSKLAAGAEKKLGVSATARNLRSATKILELANLDHA